MGKHIVNKDVKHNGIVFPQGAAIDENHAAFGALKAQGHVSPVVEVKAPVIGEGAQEKEQKPARK